MSDQYFDDVIRLWAELRRLLGEIVSINKPTRYPYQTAKWSTHQPAGPPQPHPEAEIERS